LALWLKVQKKFKKFIGHIERCVIENEAGDSVLFLTWKRQWQKIELMDSILPNCPVTLDHSTTI
jgi:hypothetical protein